MNRFSRQENIAGWDQRKLAEGVVTVVGRGWLGTFLVWALCSLGVGKVLWFGRPRVATQRMAEWFLTDPAPFDGCVVQDLPSDPAYESALGWMTEGHLGKQQVLVDCSEDRGITQVSHRFCTRRANIPWLAGGVSEGGWLTRDPGTIQRQECCVEREEPIVALAVSALLADAVRVLLGGLPNDSLLAEGCLAWEFSTGAANTPSHGGAVLVGVGGIGVYVATLLAACGHAALLVDFDRVEESNRNRQGLFTRDDTTERLDKAVVARSAIKRFFPQAQVLSSVQHVDSGFRATIEQMRPYPAALLSAVDNARTRLVLQDLGQTTGLPVVQGGTDVFGADCFTQAVGGLLLHELMHGVLCESAEREEQAAKRNRGCAVDPSYVVPGMIAGAMIARRYEQLLFRSKGSRPVQPIRWRQAALPCESEPPNEHTDLEGLC
jgi:tRNA A37 threonylcarbamoyladenosine dehydratase